jgi:hypothetical protein
VPDPWLPLELEGHGNRPLPCLLRTHGDEAGIAVVLPGGSLLGGRIGGTPARPDLAYTRALLQAQGLAVLEVWWQTDSLPEDDLDAWLRENALAAFPAARQRLPLRVVVARSLGTMALAASLYAAGDAATVWISPLVREAGVAEAVLETGPRAFLVAGSADAHWDPAAADAMREAGVRVVELSGADHSLEVADAAESARLLAGVLDEMRAFLAPVAATSVGCR